MKKIIFAAMMLAALASCSKNENTGITDSGSISEIKLSGKALSVETKGAYDSTIPTAAAPLNTFVIGSKVTGNYTTENQHVSGVMSFSGKAVGFNAGFAGDKKYPIAQAPVYMVGFHPETGWVDAGAGSVSLVMNGTQDVMLAPQIETTSADVAAAGTIKNFEFKHNLTQIEVKVVVDGDQDAADAWGVLKAMSLPGQFNSTATVTMADGSIAFSNPVVNWNLYTVADAVFTDQSFVLPFTNQASGDADAASKVAGYTMIAPVTVTAGVKAFDIAITSGVIGGTEVLTSVPVVLKEHDGNDFTGSTEGTKFTVLLVFKTKTIHATATVEAWKLGGISTIPIE